MASQAKGAHSLRLYLGMFQKLRFKGKCLVIDDKTQRTCLCLKIIIKCQRGIGVTSGECHKNEIIFDFLVELLILKF